MTSAILIVLALLVAVLGILLVRTLGVLRSGPGDEQASQGPGRDTGGGRADSGPEPQAGELAERLRALETRAAELEALRRETEAARARADQAERELRDRLAELSERERSVMELSGRAQGAKDEAEQLKAEISRLSSELAAREETLRERGRRLDERENQLGAERATAQSRADRLDARQEQLERDRSALETERESITAELERVSGLSAAQARAELIAQAEQAARRTAALRARRIEADAQADADRIARGIITTTIQRIASEVTSGAVVTTVEVPNDEMKGRIIGREGRNIRAFEQITGVNVMVDDTPGSVLLSCFDPVRREIARVTMAELIADGRIHPARIEEVHGRCTEQVMAGCRRLGEQACLDLGFADIDPDLHPTIGALRYRTSYGQNVLDHMLECGRIAGSIAAELGLDVDSCKRAAFLHDIGKAVVTDGAGSHALEGADLLRRHGESDAVVNAVGSHHQEIEPDCVEAVIAQTADAISGSRPGARRESLEAYVQRLERLEEIAGSHEGVDKVFAMQAGREVRVMVLPETVDEAGSIELAETIAHEVEEELTYPGTIRITVVRETRATRLAH
ncbi:ribonuclease Y [Propionibacterium australiense]|uniref:Ribonuclease Y n=1 Tax=Propionibacterium australiense TaxID=119981 RepID=A0A383S4B5_9ACTN|nr:ribonuclease Y [Propionibacterium australiense]RLP10632.1 ribonuclease Y [Propionibacterium australiense]RLP12927.1 ribonuclease Y [Propionibacterium australiense]SYZ32835.1 HD/PDEase domain [Propionibacterium australiense]VEH91149.1 Ribonuclease Y [Propionibacterium australiense]